MDVIDELKKLVNLYGYSPFDPIRRAIAEIERLRVSLLAASDDQSAKAMELRELNKMTERDGDAIFRLQAERDKLRDSQFRWIPISERVPEAVIGHSSDQVFFWGEPLNNVVVARAQSRPYGTTHWAPIPPLPEKSQEEKDEELWKGWCNSPTPNNPVIQSARAAFLAGLKAARSQQP